MFRHTLLQDIYRLLIWKWLYASFIRPIRVYTLVYVDADAYMEFLKEISRDRCWLQKVWYGSDRDHLAQVQGEQIIFQWCIVGIILKLFVLVHIWCWFQEEQRRKENRRISWLLIWMLIDKMLAISVIFDFHKSWSRSIVAMSCISFVISLLWCQGHVTAYFGFPTMPGMIDAMWLVVICKLLMYPHLVGWMSQSPLGWEMDVCMSPKW